MKLSGEQILPALRKRVWDLFNNPERRSKLIPGCEKLDVLGSDEYGGTINVGIASVKGVYTGKLRLEDKRAPEHYKLVVDGKGKQGFMRGSGTLDLEAREGNSTVVRYAGDVQVGGPLVQVGQRVIDSAAKMMLGQFFAAAGCRTESRSSGNRGPAGISD
jgi:carbon monoxide dehydrogenase subunit G